MERTFFLSRIKRFLKSHPIVGILGPRQCGKTTLAKMFCKTYPQFSPSNYFDLESPIDLQRLENPLLALKPLRGLIVIDEIQRFPDLFPILRVLADDETLDQQYLILGSASRELIKQSSESLAGRIIYLELPPFSFQEVENLNKLWLRGGFPRSYLASDEEESFDWRSAYIRTFLEQDIPNLGFRIPPVALRRFWIMLAHYHGNIFNSSELGRSFGASDTTMRKYLDLLTGTFMVRQLHPWHANIGKRQVKSPKIYFRDSGILHSLLNIPDHEALLVHPKIGASWEGFAMEEVIKAHQASHDECFFWSTYSDAEVDLLIQKGSELIGIEFKYMDAPKKTKSMQIALKDLPIKKLQVIYPGDKAYALSEEIFVSGLTEYLSALIKDRMGL
ncbi:MAG: ATP-binding protein [Chlamydiales bacterium]|nr:ATP-binding protein [Chlamydiales bacterium]